MLGRLPSIAVGLFAKLIITLASYFIVTEVKTFVPKEFRVVSKRCIIAFPCYWKTALKFRTLTFALEIAKYNRETSEPLSLSLNFKLLAKNLFSFTGSCVAGVVGLKMPRYCKWGIAKRRRFIEMELKTIVVSQEYLINRSFSFEGLFGDTVNTASRMESTGEGKCGLMVSDHWMKLKFNYKSSNR